jgi:ubiquinone/menaquinone biosynthesis C-methylase UbiE
MTSSKAISTFEELKASYENIWSFGVMKEEDRYYRQIVRLLEAKPGRRLLDVACGAGSLLAFGADAGLQVHGLDISEEALERSQQLCPEADLKQGLAEHLPYPDGYFDYVTCLGSIEHFLDPAAGLAEMRRVLKDDGEACVVLPNQWALPDVLCGWISGRGLAQNQELARVYSLDEARNLLWSEGEFWVEKVQGYNGPPEDIVSTRSLGSPWDTPYLWLYKRLRHRIPLTLSYVFIFLMRKHPPSAPRRFKLGDTSQESGLVPSGWYWAEPGPPASRWSKGKASLFLQANSGAQSLRLTALDNCPSGALHEARLRILLDERDDLGEQVIEAGKWEELHFPLPSEARGRVVKLTFRVSRTWSPQQVLGNSDPRELGLAVQEVWTE